MLCAYGCDQEAKYQFKNGKWCCNKFSSQCSENRKKFGQLGRHFSSEHKRKLKRSFSEEHKKKISEKLTGIRRSEETRKKIKENHADITGEKNPFYGKHHTNETKEKIGKGRKGKQVSKNQRDIMSRKMKEKWNDSSFRKKCLLLQKPTKPEVFLTNFLDEVVTNKYNYVGDGQVWIAGKNPDFINGEEKKLIEFFGRFWHKEEDEFSRLQHFKEQGYRTLIIWEEELQDLNSLKRKILEFQNV